jgi:2-methylcitrate dehydratase PrpD
VFNSCGGSFQSHIDGSLGVRINQGRSAHDAVVSARLAQIGITGPRNFLTGIYGYLQLYGKGEFTGADIVEGLGADYRLQEVAFKKYPSCAMTLGPTEVALTMLKQQGLDPARVSSVKLTLPPYGYRLVGNEFKIGDNPTVDGQFSARYCIANAFLRGASKMRHFTAQAVRDAEIMNYVSKVSVSPDPSLDRRGHTAMDMVITMMDGRVYKDGLDIAPGFPGNPLTDDDHMQRFRDCIDFAVESDGKHVEEIVSFVKGIENESDVTALVKLLSDTDRPATTVFA